MNLPDAPLSREPDIEAIKIQAQEEIAKQDTHPFRVTVMGQTGNGKSSLINALFHQNLPTDPVLPTTKQIDTVGVTDPAGHRLIFHDMPGVGESDEANERYLADYRQKLIESDVVLWTIHADTRSVTFDLDTLRLVLAGVEPSVVGSLVSKITFVLTKADLVLADPWVYALERRQGTFVPGEQTRELLARKADYFERTFIAPYGDRLSAETYQSNGFSPADPRMTTDGEAVFFRGYLGEGEFRELTGRYPASREVLERLRRNFQVVPCSARFRYNLTTVLIAAVNKLGLEAIGRFKHFTATNDLDTVPVGTAKTYGNIIVYDVARQRRLFDLAQQTF